MGKKAVASRLCSELVVDTTKNTQLLGWTAPYSVDKSLEKMFNTPPEKLSLITDMSILFFLIFFLLAFAMTYFMRHYALKKNIIDNPNERSSHSVPTPRGGGVAVVCSYLVALAVLMYSQQLELQTGFYP